MFKFLPSFKTGNYRIILALILLINIMIAKNFTDILIAVSDDEKINC